MRKQLLSIVMSLAMAIPVTGFTPVVAPSPAQAQTFFGQQCVEGDFSCSSNSGSSSYRQPSYQYQYRQPSYRGSTGGSFYGQSCVEGDYSCSGGNSYNNGSNGNNWRNQWNNWNNNRHNNWGNNDWNNRRDSYRRHHRDYRNDRDYRRPRYRHREHRRSDNDSGFNRNLALGGFAFATGLMFGASSAQANQQQY